MKRPRFSLRSLLLLTLFLAAGGTVWVLREPWYLQFQVSEMTGPQLNYAEMDASGKLYGINNSGIIYCVNHTGLALEIDPEQKRLGEVSRRLNRVPASELQYILVEADASDSAKVALKPIELSDNGYYALLDDSHGRLYSWNGKAAHALGIERDRENIIQFAPNQRFVFLRGTEIQNVLIDCEAGRVIANPRLVGSRYGDGIDVAPDGSRLIEYCEGGHRILALPSEAEWVLSLDRYKNARARIAGPDFIVFGTSTGLDIWKRRRHESHWGFAERHEVWLTLILGIAFGVSLWRDWREFRREKSAAPVNNAAAVPLA